MSKTEKAVAYRKMAEELREAAKSLSEIGRSELLMIAAQYDELAGRIERD